MAVTHNHVCSFMRLSASHSPVVVLPCRSYESSEVENVLSEMFRLLGGAQRFFRPGETVLLKPNLMMEAQPERAITTHPVVISAVTKVANASGCHVLAGDSPAGRVDSLGLGRIWDVTGLAELEKSELVTRSVFERDQVLPTGSYDFPWGKLLIARAVAQANVIVNLPKLKTHPLMGISAAFKNMLGIVPGMLKSRIHCLCPGSHAMAGAILKIAELAQPALTIVDAVECLEGDGPAMAGRPVRLGLMIGGIDLASVEVACALAAQMRPEDLPCCRAAHEMWHCSPSRHRTRRLRLGANQIEFVGDGNLLQSSRGLVPAGHTWWTRSPGLTRMHFTAALACPAIRKERCTGCGNCACACPVGAINLCGKLPVVEATKCIQCFCCMEVCPEGAIAFERVGCGNR